MPPVRSLQFVGGIDVLASRIIFIIAAALAATVAIAASAAAATVAPSASAKAAIVRGFGDPAAASSCLRVRLAASDHRYAEVAPRLTSSCQRWAFNGVNVLERVAGGRWKVLFEGSSYRCPVAGVPHSVQRDLGVCPQ